MKNSTFSASVRRRSWPKEIIVEPARLSLGLWGERKGDIAAAYSADRFPNIRTFLHDSQLFTNTGGTVGHGREAVAGYPLIPSSDYRGPKSRPFSYEGQSVRFRRRDFRLGPKVAFVPRERTVAEWTDSLRRQYAHGGYFASGKTYAEVLVFFAEQGPISANERAAIDAEAKRADLPQTQEAMLASFAMGAAQRQTTQLELILGI